jgi:outer membrane protein OmpA-like peptidoglycan-associated protein
MKQELTFEAEPFQGYTDFDEFEFRPVDPELFEAEAAFEWMGEVSRSNPEYIRWIQQSLNKILSLQLKVDGISGPQTRSAVRSFQQKKGLVADGIVGPKTETALIASGASPAPGSTGAPGTSAACPPTPKFVDCPVPGTAPTEVLDQFAFNVASLNRPRHTPIILKVARQIHSSQSSRQPIRSILIAGHTDPSGTDDFNFDLARRRAEEVARELCITLDRMRPGLARQIKFELTSCGERQQKTAPESSRRVEIFLPRTTPPPRPRPPRPRPPRPVPTCPPPPAQVPPELGVIIRLVQQLLRSLMPVLGPAGVKLPTTARFLNAAEQAEAMKIFGCSLDYTKSLISDGLGFSGRPFTVAVPLASGFHTVLLVGDVSSWHTSPRSNTLIHELTHSWQSQHHGSDPTAYMQNSVRCQAAALVDLPIAKAAAGAAASAAAVRRGVINPIDLARIAAAAAAAEDVSAYAYIPGRPFADYAAEQIAEQVEDTYRGRSGPAPAIVATIRSVAANARSVDNEKSLGVTSFHRKSTPGVVFR